ncbi:TlpA family protein disulfide reductase [Pedobacter gandavensis]|uniref:TlpA family protein disulfide reductase n=1 Tax=Pedobacter gandavensis TaxID=2679963 RepID=UPI0029308A9B|nr:redoxin domain-containing protein [Pedobacter gandavensis]
MKIIYSILLFLLPISVVNGQNRNQPEAKKSHKIKNNVLFKNLRVGDSVPNIQIAKIINDNIKSAKISDFKDRLLIIDFWATNCTSCVSALPELDSLQKVFGHKIKILPVTYEDEQITANFLKKNKKVSGLNITSVVEDKVLSKWFKHRVISHEVWIYKGRVIAITAPEYVDAHNIQKVLDGQHINWPVKDDFLVFHYDKPLFNVSDVNFKNEKRILQYSGILGYQEGAYTKSGSVIDTIRGTKRYYLINHSILAAYKRLWEDVKTTAVIPIPPSGTNIFTPTQLILEVKDRSRYIYDKSKDYRENWKRMNEISYEFVTSDTGLTAKEISKKMIDDLDRRFGLYGRWEKRQIKCLALVRTSSLDKLKSVATGNEFEFRLDESIKKIRNSAIGNLVLWLNNYHGNPPVFNETNYKGNIDIDLNISSWTDIYALRKALQAYDLDLKETTRNLDVFILKDD